MVSCTEVEGERTEGMEKTEQRGKAGRIDAGQKKDAALRSWREEVPGIENDGERRL